jgi:serine/threonine-protein kinase
VDPLIGQVLADRFRVVRLLGVGGMGQVFEVEHTQLPKRFAIKVLGSALAKEAEALKRFRREAEIVAGLQHPHIVEIIDWGSAPDGRPFYVMELLEGIDLSAQIAKGPLTWPEIRTLAEQSISALQEAHRKGVMHRDIKPTNIFLKKVESGIHVKLIDFGLARARDMAAITIYTSPKLIGTPAFMSPEQILGKGPVEEEADTWAIAAVLYAAAAGKAPFRGSFAVLVAQIGKKRPVPLRVLRSDAPAAFADALAAALSPNTEQRIRSLDELRERVADSLGGELPSTSALPVSQDVTPSSMPTKRGRPPAKESAPPRGTRLPKWTIGLALGALAVGLGALVLGGEEEDPVASAAPEMVPAPPEKLASPLPDAQVQADAQVQTFDLTVDTFPRGAKLFVDMVYAGEDGTTFRRARGTELTVTCHQAGFDGGEVKLVFDYGKRHYACKLRKKGRKKARKSDKSPKPPKQKAGDELNDPEMMLPDF